MKARDRSGRNDDGDSVLRVLATSTLVGAVGRGILLTMTVLYLGLIVGLGAGEIAIVVGAGSASGLICGVIAGHLSDHVSAKRLLLGGVIVESLAFLSYALITDLQQALLATCVAQGAASTGSSARSAILGRAFRGETRVRARAVLRTLTNVGVAVGSALAAVPLASGSAGAYRAALVVAAVVYLLAQLNLVRLPAHVDVTAVSSPGAVPRRAFRRGLSISRHSPWRDPRYLLLTVLSGVFGIELSIGAVGVPLWVVHDTSAPRTIIPALLIINTAIVIAFTVPLSRSTHRVRTAGRATLAAGGLMVLACGGYAIGHGLPVIWACGALMAAAAAHAFAEVLEQAGGWGLSFELADPVRIGSYQGVFGTGYSLGAAAGPALVTATAIAHGVAGWAVIATILLASAAGIAGIAERAARHRPELS